MSADFGGKGASPTNRCWCYSSRVIALSCGIKISAVHHLDLSQSTRVTDGRTDRQNDDSQDHPRICSRSKNPNSYFVYIFRGLFPVLSFCGIGHTQELMKGCIYFPSFPYPSLLSTSSPRPFSFPSLPLEVRPLKVHSTQN